MAKYHLRSDGTPGVCKARPGKCPLGDDRPHFESAPEARAAYEREREEGMQARAEAYRLALAQEPVPGSKASYELLIKFITRGDELAGAEIDELVAYNENMAQELSQANAALEQAKSTLGAVADELVNGKLSAEDKLYNIALTLKAHNKASR